jgi:hypothetical protein
LRGFASERAVRVPTAGAACALLVLLVGAAAAGGVKVDVGRDADLSGYATYRWERGAAEKDDRVQHAIEEAMERELAAAGLERVDSGGELAVAAVAITQSVTGTTVDPGYWGGGSDFGVPTVNIAEYAKGTLLVQIKDGTTGDLLWQASGKAKLQVGQGKDSRRKIDTLVRKIVKLLPR